MIKYNSLLFPPSLTTPASPTFLPDSVFSSSFLTCVSVNVCVWVEMSVSLRECVVYVCVCLCMPAFISVYVCMHVWVCKIVYYVYVCV